MMGPAVLERPGRWRAAGLGVLLVLAALPLVPPAAEALGSFEGAGSLGGARFLDSLKASALEGLAVSLLALAVGLPGGVLAALYDFPVRRALLAFSALPLLVPSLLAAIGWSRLASSLGPSASLALSSHAGTVLVFAGSAVPLVILASWAACALASGSALDAARLGGGERAAFLRAAGHAAPPALLAAVLGGLLALGDPGPGQILGPRGAGSEILTSFAATRDAALAARQSAVLAALALALALPAALLAAPRLAEGLLAREVRGAEIRSSRPAGRAGLAILSAVVLFGSVLPAAGLLLPLRRGVELGRAAATVARTLGDTVVVGAGGGAGAVILGFAAAFLAGRERGLRAILVTASAVVLALPSSLGALGILQAGTRAPAWADPIVRGRPALCLALGAHLFPVAAVLGLRAWGSLSQSWALAGELHGVPLPRYLLRVVLPRILPAAFAALLLTALLAASDVSAALLLAPPGASTLPLALFTVMANAPEALVATLCALHLSLAAAALLGAALLVRSRAA
ncbi:MAG: hypothetical protein HY721_11050 [Planctomycetes bacterium]|nr:hypothetical protein [Planctomycetota bacterium]